METKIGPYSHSEYKMYTEEEADSLLGETMRMIFRDEPPNDDGINPCMPVFRKQHWTTVALIGNLNTSEGQTLYVPDPVTEPDFDLHIRRDQLDPLWEILSEDHVAEAFIYSEFGKTHSAVGFEPNRDAMTDAFDDVTLIGTGWLFDRTATWGVHASIEDFSFLGGEPAMMKRFIEKAGGIGILQTRMKYRMAHHFSREGDAGERWLNEWYSDYELMGWPWPYPVFPEGKPD